MNTLTKEQIIKTLREAMDSRTECRVMCLDLVALGTPCLNLIKEIALDRSVDFYVRRFALVVGARFQAPAYDDFLYESFIKGRDKRALLASYESGSEEAMWEIGLLNKASDILNNPALPRRDIGG